METNMKQEVLTFNLSKCIPTKDMLSTPFHGHRLVLNSDVGDYTTYSLDFLEDLVNAERITEVMIAVNFESLQPLSAFSALRSLSIGRGAKQEIDFSSIRHLKSLSVTGTFIYRNLHELSLSSLAVTETKAFPFEKINSGLQSLYLRHINVDWGQIDRFHGLSNLNLIQLPIQDLGGMSELTALTECVIAYCPKLKDFSGLRFCRSLQTLELDHVKGVSAEDLSYMPNLRKLILSDAGALPSIKFIDSLPNLKFLSFVGTNILDGDLTPCLRLDYAGTLNKRHYNLKSNQLPGNHSLKE